MDWRSLLCLPWLIGFSACTGCGDRSHPPDSGPSQCSPALPSPTESFKKPACWSQALLAFNPARGTQLGVNPAAGSCVGLGFGTYWLDEAEDLRLDIFFGRGPEQFPPQFPESVKSAVLIDGVQAPFTVDGAPATLSAKHTLEREGEPIRFLLTVASKDIPVGVHSFLFTLRGQAVSPSFPMTVVKAGYERPPPSASPNGISTAFMGGNFVRRSDNGRLLDAKAIGQDNPLKLVVALERLIQDCPNRKLGTLTVAMLDGEQLPLTSTTPYLRDDLAFKDRREFEVDVRDLPHDGEAHQLVFLQYDAEREFAEDGNGKLTPWGVLMGATPIGGARWQD